ncbi:putative meiotic recombination-related protein [Dioszegia hungarica]|uniref:Meiotic recombination-related protein n=1 Tax=Dioszegia hungarica TaxID=4972 RepID=A0AA38HBE3_9TREE|nr:putative meiotic recombination-related protein [Dioszegia hungarica]KAI9637308.1 putative meiotic recombination-related protein [Dioszegia hungarica]
MPYTNSSSDGWRGRGGRGGGGRGGGRGSYRGREGRGRGGGGWNNDRSSFYEGRNQQQSSSSNVESSPPRANNGGGGGRMRGRGIRWGEPHFLPPDEDREEGGTGAGGDDNEDVPEEGNGDVRKWDERRVLSIHSPSGYNFAAAFWDPEQHKILVVEDTKDTTGWDLASLVMEQTSPEMIIMSSAAHYSLIDIVRAYCEENKVTLSLQVRQSYNLASATHALSQARLPDASAPVHEDEEESVHPSSDANSSAIYAAQARRREEVGTAGMGRIRLSMVKLGAWVNVDAPAAVCASGGLLTYLQKLKAGSVAIESGPGVELDGIESLSLDQHMLINQDALNSLAVFDTESHAYSYSTQKKTAISLFGLLNTCVTPSGKRLLHTWHLRPLLSLPVIRARHAAVSFFSYIDNQHTADISRTHLKKFGNVNRVMNLLRRGRGQVAHWKILADSLTACMMVRDQIVGMLKTYNVDIVKKVIEGVDQQLYEFVHNVTSVKDGALADLLIDWDASRDRGRTCVKTGIDGLLDQYREQFAQLNSQLDAISQRIVQTVDPSFCDTLVVKYIPQLGFFLVVELLRHDLPAPPGWEITFDAEGLHYFKNEQMHHLDEHFGDLENCIADREIEIIQQLVESVRTVDERIMAVNDIIAELDCLLALAFAAVQYDLRCPTMTDEPVLHIQNGRHFLQELTVQQYICNDTMMQGGQDGEYCSMMVVTGANGSGKSAYGKQVALIAFMAQIGSFVPAETAEIGVCDRIYTRLQTKESVSRTGSAFMIDLSQVSHALRGATERSLIILDEFGKGTTSADGAGLLAGVIDHLIHGARPRTIVLTHFHELFTQQFLEPELPILFCHMRTLIQDGAEELTYLFKLVPSLSTTSNAAECAIMHGVPAHVVNRAREVTRCISTFQLASLLDQELTGEELKELTQAEELAKLFLEWEIDEGEDDVQGRIQEILYQVEGPGEGDESGELGSEGQGEKGEARMKLEEAEELGDGGMEE